MTRARADVAEVFVAALQHFQCALTHVIREHGEAR